MLTKDDIKEIDKLQHAFDVVCAKLSAIKKDYFDDGKMGINEIVITLDLKELITHEGIMSSTTNDFLYSDIKEKIIEFYIKQLYEQAVTIRRYAIEDYNYDVDNEQRNDLLDFFQRR